MIYSIDEAQANLEELVDAATAGEVVLIATTSGTFVQIVPIDDANKADGQRELIGEDRDEA